VCFFLSLTLSLSTVSVGILCLQWLREYQREPEVSPEQVIAIRYFRLRGIDDWRVRSIIGFLPLILQVSLFLFFIGLVLFLFNTNKTLAIVVSCAVGTTMFILVATSIIPALQAVWNVKIRDHSLCPCRSPQAWLFRQCWLFGTCAVHRGVFGCFWLWVWLRTGGVSELRTRLVGVPPLLKDRVCGFMFRLRNRTRPSPDIETGQPAPINYRPTTALGLYRRWWDSAQRFQNSLTAEDWLTDDSVYVSATLDRVDPSTGSVRASAMWTKGVALGLASVPRRYLRNIPALCAMIHCVHDSNPDQWEMMLERIDSVRTRCLVELLRNGGTRRLVMGRCLTLAYVLDHSAECNSQFRSITLSYRFELFLRTLNQFLEDCIPIHHGESPGNESQSQAPGHPSDHSNDTAEGMKWWELIRSQAIHLNLAYQFGETNMGKSIPEGEPLFYVVLIRRTVTNRK
jgi:hypothetical protein